ncbi:MAG: urea ABC transporter permease subunit UrtC [Oscillatoriales cyanobacterium]|nr:MAG: urea ABC transporter permease subunit UrtC [Oscillatoriales cyanobacterium]
MTVTSRLNRNFWTNRKTIEAIVVVALGLFVMFALPLLLSDFRLKLLGRFLSLTIAALGIDLIWGYTGMLSLGHGLFFALGGYALAMHANLQLPEGQMPEFFMLYGVSELPMFWKPFASFPFTAIAIFTIPAIIAGLLGYLIFRNRIRGVYFSILTQAALIVFFNFFNGQQKLINGTNGLKTDTETMFGVLMSSPEAQIAFFRISVLLLVLGYLLCRWLTSGRFGRLLIAIRDDESRVRFSGYDPTGFKVLVFAVSGALAGIAGALYTAQSGIITPSAMEVSTSIEMVIWVAVGGRATLVGAIIGTLLVSYARTFLSEEFPAVWLFFQGALFLIVVTALPDGIMGVIRDRLWPFLQNRLGLTPIVPFPSLTDPEVEYERQQFESKD